MKNKILLIMILSLLSSRAVIPQEYLVPGSALESFLNGNLKQLSFDFVKNNGGKLINTETNEWYPVPGFYIEYRHQNLRYWFTVSSESRQNIYFNRLYNLIKSDAFKDFRETGGYVRAVKFNQGDYVPKGDLMSSGHVQNALDKDDNDLRKLGDKLSDFFNEWDGLKPPNDDYYDSENFKNESAEAEKHLGELQNALNNLMNNRGFGDKVNSLRDRYYKQVGLDPSKPNGDIGDGENAEQNVGNENGDGGNGGNGGMEGPFKIKIPFSKWFAHLLDILARYFGIKEISQKILAVAYFIVPQLFDEVGSFLAKLQHAITPDSINDFLNTVSNLLDRIDRFYRYATAIKDLLNNPDFQSLFEGEFKDIDWQNAITNITKAGDELTKLKIIPPDQWNNIKNYMGYASFLDGPEAFKEKIKVGLKKLAFEQGKKMISKTPIGKYIPLDELENCIKSKLDKESCKGLLKEGIKKNLPEKYRDLAAAVDSALNGKFRKAGEQILLRYVPQNFKDDVQKILDGKKDYSKEELAQIAENILRYSGHEKIANAIKTGVAGIYALTKAEEIKEDIKRILKSSSKLSNSTIQKYLNKHSPDILSLMARGFGIVDSKAQEEFIKGNITEAIQLQVQSGVVTRDMNYYKNLGNQLRNQTMNRIAIISLIQQAMKNKKIPYDITNLLRYSSR